MVSTCSKRLMAFHNPAVLCRPSITPPSPRVIRYRLWSSSSCGRDNCFLRKCGLSPSCGHKISFSSFLLSLPQPLSCLFRFSSGTVFVHRAACVYCVGCFLSSKCVHNIHLLRFRPFANHYPPRVKSNGVLSAPPVFAALFPFVIWSDRRSRREPQRF